MPHLWVPEKIATDCLGCPLFRRCGQYAMMLPLREQSRAAAASTAAPDRRVAAAVA